MNIGSIILIILVGLLLMILDFLVIPGGVVAIFGVLCMIAGIVASYVIYGATFGTIMIFAVAIVTLLSFYFMMRTKTWRKLQLNTQIDSKMNQISEQLKVGDQGVAISRLAQKGTGRFGDQMMEVTSLQEFVDANTPIEIVKIDQNEIFVKPLK
ncbi:MAG: NfeD family protein [Bacteroidales bacterium]|nr:NfeD family protein [Bacteroidales bacterium]